MSNINYNLEGCTTQNENIRAWLEAGNSITSLGALNKFGCFRLGARIAELRKAGLEIKGKWETLWNGKKIMRYYIEQSKNN